MSFSPSKLYQLAKKLLDKIKNPTQLTLGTNIIKLYHGALFENKVLKITRQTTASFHKYFVSNINLSDEAKLLRSLLITFMSKEKLEHKFDTSEDFGKKILRSISDLPENFLAQLHTLADKLSNKFEKGDQLNLKTPIFQDYHWALVDKKVLKIIGGTASFHEDFVAKKISQSEQHSYVL